jgi:hypothetical protein
LCSVFLTNYDSDDQITKTEIMGRACNTHVGEERCVEVLMEKPERKRPLEKPRHR